MRDDRTTLEMLKEVAFKAPWPLVERVTHLILAVIVGYWIGSHGKSEAEKSFDRVEQRTAQLMQEIRQKRLEGVQERGQDSRVGRISLGSD